MRFKPRYKSCFWSKVDIWGQLYQKRSSLLHPKWDRIISTLVSKKRRRYQRLCKDYNYIKPPSRANLPYKFPRWAFRNSLSNRLCLRRFYGDLGSKQFKNLCTLTSPQLLIRKLESRLDICLYRLGFFLSIFESRQAIAHGKVSINGQKVSFDHYKLKVGDLVEFDDTFRSALRSNLLLRRCLPKSADRLKVCPTPGWIQTDYSSLSFIVVDKLNCSIFYPFRVEFDEILSTSKYK